jgi:hypothetical protein
MKYSFVAAGLFVSGRRPPPVIFASHAADPVRRLCAAAVMGRIGSPWLVRRDRHPSEGEAVSALAKLARQKHRRGYGLQEMQ